MPMQNVFFSVIVFSLYEVGGNAKHLVITHINIGFVVHMADKTKKSIKLSLKKKMKKKKKKNTEKC